MARHEFPEPVKRLLYDPQSKPYGVDDFLQSSKGAFGHEDV